MDVLELQYGCASGTLTKRIEKEQDEIVTKTLRAVLSKS